MLHVYKTNLSLPIITCKYVTGSDDLPCNCCTQSAMVLCRPSEPSYKNQSKSLTLQQSLPSINKS